MRNLQLAFISNRTTSRLFRILAIIERKRIFTIGELAEKIQVTERTIANDMKYMRDYFGESISLSSGNSGFIFDEKKPTSYQMRKKELLANECMFEIVGNIFYGKFFRVDELADHYHFSESSFRRILKQSSRELKKYGLQWASNPLTIHGEEASMRKFFKDFYYEGIETEYTILPDAKLHELVLTQLEGKLGDYSMGSGTTPAALYYACFISIKRSSLGYTISLPDELKQKIYKTKDFGFILSLKESIEEMYEFNMSQEELAWVYLESLCQRTLDREDQEQRFYDYFNQGEEIAGLTEKFLNMHQLSGEKNRFVRTFMRSFFLSRKINQSISPVLNKEMDELKESVQQFDQKSYQRNFQFLSDHGYSLFNTFRYMEDIATSLTVYSNLILDIYTPSKKIYFLLEGDHFICQYIRTRAIQQFGVKHTLTFLPLHALTKEVIQSGEVDLIVTNYARYVLDYIGDTDYHLLKPAPDEQDWQLLEGKIDPYRKKVL